MANQPNRFIRLSPEENKRLRELEQNPHIHPKVRLRAQILRLSHEEMRMQGIGQYIGKSYDTVRTTFARWEKEGYAGLADHYEQHGQEAIITRGLQDFIREKLAEARTWTCEQLSEAIFESHGVKVGPEGIRLRLKEMGYSWKKGRFIPAKRPSEEDLKHHKAALDTLKRGLVKDA